MCITNKYIYIYIYTDDGPDTWPLPNIYAHMIIDKIQDEQ